MLGTLSFRGGALIKQFFKMIKRLVVIFRTPPPHPARRKLKENWVYFLKSRAEMVQWFVRLKRFIWTDRQTDGNTISIT